MQVLKRAQFSILLELGEGWVIGVKGYGLVVEQKMEVAGMRTVYLDEYQQTEIQKSQMLYMGSPSVSG
ncbi:hypothetical protein PILCRDRAFT_824733 [Piloderma croceum F 1598]|uniref:Uncharacterized protein n=1 Tax=Piloderma croceum (strain F 1598) TaxID=765440 RepID=A0A0C3BLQ1_PILCF|nr:hypothetical protein PILCRDRAFT_828649 [Piloderma croceum F 1598]KIM78247.1 hypothetical protein PILCRDRAFT_824733 [Piloderma croceum F 1598]